MRGRLCSSGDTARRTEWGASLVEFALVLPLLLILLFGIIEASRAFEKAEKLIGNKWIVGHELSSYLQIFDRSLDVAQRLLADGGGAAEESGAHGSSFP